jgi:ribose transport system ATP-binding protein
MGDPILRMKAVGKRFPGVVALRGVSLEIGRGEGHVLLGENGAGKSTLVKILNGVHPAGSYTGSIRLAGETVELTSPLIARARGIAYVPQEIEVFEQLTVAENVFAGQTSLGRGVLVRQRHLQERTAALFADFGLSISPSALLASLTAAQRHLVMIVRALATRPTVLMLDEPTASLSGPEVTRLFRLLKRLKAQGTTTIFITHRLPEVLALCDRATVLRDGRVAAEMIRADFDSDRIIAAMSGQRLQRLYPKHDAPTGSETLLKVTSLTIDERHGAHRGLTDVTFELRAGEILGLAGLLGSGRTELLAAIYGRIPYRGRIAVAGQAVAIDSTRAARKAGIALLTEDRKRSGLLFNLPLRDNITIGNLALFARAGIVSAEREDNAAVRAMRELNVKARSSAAAVSHLSGGNQQKLLFARVLMNAPRILLLDEPTKGVDVGTRHEIYRLIVELAEKGVGLLVVSSELEEVIGLCDRCLVIADGRLVDEFVKAEASEERVLRAIAAAQAARSIGLSGEAAA